MSTTQNLHSNIYEGIIYIHLAAGEAMTAGDVVQLSTSAGYVVKCGTSGTPFGFVAETVTAAGVADYEPGGLVSHTAKIGDVVGVYIAGGTYKHEQAGLAFGDVVYAGKGSAGKLSTSASYSAIKAGIVVEASDDDDIASVKSLL
jgi:hypothetical protein